MLLCKFICDDLQKQFLKYVYDISQSCYNVCVAGTLRGLWESDKLLMISL